MASVTCARTSAPGRAQSASQPDDAVDLRRFAVGAADERAARRRRRRRARRPRSPTSASRAARVIGSCTVLALAQPLDRRAPRRPGRRGRPRACRPRPRTGRTRPSRARPPARNASSASCSRSSSPGKPTMNDDRNAASGSGARMASMHAEEAVAAPPPLHAPQQRGDRRAAARGRSTGRPSAARAWWRRAGRAPRSGRGRGGGSAPGRAAPSVSSRRSSGASEPGCPGVAPVPREVLRDEHDLGDAAARPGRAPRPRSTPASASAACRGTTGWRRTRRHGRSPRRPSRTPTARSARAGAARAGRGRPSASGTEPVGLRARSRSAVTRGGTDPVGQRLRPRSRPPRRPRAAPPPARRRSARPCTR